ncbi:MAG: hypothetical protein AVDCRST_MAG41-3358, partial [uncultured Corynebacteriales bacterium]
DRPGPGRVRLAGAQRRPRRRRDLLLPGAGRRGARAGQPLPAPGRPPAPGPGRGRPAALPLARQRLPAGPAVRARRARRAYRRPHHRVRAGRAGAGGPSHSRAPDGARPGGTSRCRCL